MPRKRPAARTTIRSRKSHPAKVPITIPRAALGIFLLGVLIAAVEYPALPDMMVSHWNIDSRPDALMPKFWAVTLFPIITLIFLAVLAVLPRIDPRAHNIQAFRPVYNHFMVIFTAFITYVFLITLAWNLGIRFHIGQMLAPAFALLLYYIGRLIGHAKQNWFVGIRTPWTLSNQKVWDKTNQRGGMLFKVAAIIALLGIAAPGYAIWFMVVPILAIVAYLVVFSYQQYQHVKKK